MMELQVSTLSRKPNVPVFGEGIYSRDLVSILAMHLYLNGGCHGQGTCPKQPMTFIMSSMASCH